MQLFIDGGFHKVYKQDGKRSKGKKIGGAHFEIPLRALTHDDFKDKVYYYKSIDDRSENRMTFAKIYELFFGFIIASNIKKTGEGRIVNFVDNDKSITQMFKSKSGSNKHYNILLTNIDNIGNMYKDLRNLNGQSNVSNVTKDQIDDINEKLNSLHEKLFEGSPLPVIEKTQPESSPPSRPIPLPPQVQTPPPMYDPNNINVNRKRPTQRIYPSPQVQTPPPMYDPNNINVNRKNPTQRIYPTPVTQPVGHELVGGKYHKNMKLTIGCRSRRIYRDSNNNYYYKMSNEKHSANYLFKKNGQLKKSFLNLEK